MRLEFLKEVNEIKDDNLREACLKMCDEVPTYFWHVPASSSGKYHPSISLGDGGLVRHSIMVCHIGLDLLNAEIFIRDTDINRDLVRVATLFHDILKQGKGDSNHTVFEHPILSADVVKHYLEDAGVDNVSIETICSGIASHMGKWTTSKYNKDIVLEAPKTDFEKLVHTADYIASRKYINGLESWAKENNK